MLKVISHQAFKNWMHHLKSRKDVVGQAFTDGWISQGFDAPLQAFEIGCETIRQRASLAGFLYERVDLMVDFFRHLIPSLVRRLEHMGHAVHDFEEIGRDITIGSFGE